jgi:ribosome recycling factor
MDIKMDDRLKDYSRKMASALEVLGREFSGLRTGRASVNLLDPIKVDAYGTFSPISQVGAISTPEARLITVTVWDHSLVKSVEKAIRDSNLGLNPSVEGQTLRIPLPLLTEERRQELTKIAAKYAEDGRISVRNVRRDGMEHIKKMEKDKLISEDEQHRLSDEMQKVTDAHIKQIDELLAHKQKDIMVV